ncbi:MAG: hypothetical protein KDJ51_01215 [Nitratireductor sp.]|nr:hypothetical protein [Nitratireductor sp.]
MEKVLLEATFALVDGRIALSATDHWNSPPNGPEHSGLQARFGACNTYLVSDKTVFKGCSTASVLPQW